MNGQPSLLRQILGRQRIVTALCLLLLCGLAWLYLASGAGMGRSNGMAMGDGMAMDRTMPAMGRPGFLLVVAMWWVMMVAMMLPSAAPAILLYEKVEERALSGGTSSRPAPALVFASGYLFCWLLFSVAAAAIELQLQARGLIDPERFGLTNRIVTGVLLLVAGLYQVSSLKSVCLSHCRSPASFFARHWRPGWSGAVRLGMWHGAYCVACCWALMLLLFAGGVMNLLWVVVLSLLVLAEKVLPFGTTIGRVTGALLVAAGAGLLLFGLAL